MYLFLMICVLHISRSLSVLYWYLDHCAHCAAQILYWYVFGMHGGIYWPVLICVAWYLMPCILQAFPFDVILPLKPNLMQEVLLKHQC